MADPIHATAWRAAVLLVIPSLACVVAPDASPFTFDTAAVETPHEDEPDDAPDDDSGSESGAQEAPPHMIAFVTSVGYDADFGGVTGADETCQFEAEAAQLEGTFRAWISSSSANAIDRIEGDGPWHDVDGVLLFNNHAHLRTAPLAAIDVDPFGNSLFYSPVWTGTGAGGHILGPDTCGDWTSSDWMRQAGTGATETGTTWTDAGPMPCEWEAYLYCFQVNG